MRSYRMLKDSLKGKIRFDEQLSRHTTFRIGGPAKIWVEPHDEKDLKEILQFARNHKLNIFIIGLGSNILADDKGFNGIVIHFSYPYFKRIDFKKSKVKTGAGARLADVVRLSCKHSLGGLEGLVGIPGTVGGAVRMNSGYKKSIAELIHKVRVMDKRGAIRTFCAGDLKFDYRSSNLFRYIILEVELNLKKMPKRTLVKKYEYFFGLKKNSQPWNKKSAGCVFKNPQTKGNTAARLIESCGLKGKTIGGAKISEKHANFIINMKSASSSDVVQLMDLIRRKVKNKFNLKLETELVRI